MDTPVNAPAVIATPLAVPVSILEVPFISFVYMTKSSVVWVIFGFFMPEITKLTSTAPDNGAGDVPLGANITATFSEAMDPLTISTATFTLEQGTTPVAGTVIYAGVTAIFNPTGDFAPNTLYTATMMTGVADLSGNELASDYIWTFTTGAAPDNTAPMVSSTAPANVAVDVPLGANIAATFSEAMDPLTISTATFTLYDGAAPVLGTVTYAGVTAMFNPTNALVPGTVYIATIETEAADLTGNPLASAYAWSFTTGAAQDTTAPTVSSTAPANGAIGVPLSANLAATFSEAMDPLTITTLTFTLAHGTIPVSGAVIYAGVTAVFNPTVNLLPNTLYTATIKTGAADLSGNALASAYVWTFTTGALPDTTAPMVSSTAPADADIDVPLGANLAATFSEAMNPLTINTATFTLALGVTPLPGTVTYAGVTAMFNPAGILLPNTLYTGTITAGVADLSGNALASDYVWNFTTGAAPDITAPTVISTDPADLDVGVPANRKVAATFSEAMDPLTISTATFTLYDGAVPVVGTVTYAGVTATFAPTGGLALNTLYTATVTIGAADLSGNGLASDHVWTFTTGPLADITAPTVFSTDPIDGAIGVPLNKKIAATFSEAIDPLTITTVTITLDQGLTPIPGTVTYEGLTAVFTPAGNLTFSTAYTATVTTGVTDLAGNALASDYVWNFTTGVSTGQDGIDLRSAGTFAILAGATVTSTGPSIVNGDLGLSPGAAVVGFPPAILNGLLFTGVSSLAGQAKLDLTVAFNDAAGRSVGPVSLPGDLSGLTLYPGLYTNSTSVMLSAGNVTLDAQGDANAVFIFQMGSTLTTGSGTQVILSGGAKAGNIYWQVGTSATLGTTSIFKGNILASASITLATGATLEGRALTQIAAVSLDASTITVPAP